MLSLLATAGAFALRFLRPNVFQRAEPPNLLPVWRITRGALVLAVPAPLAIVFVSAVLNPDVLVVARNANGLTWLFAVVMTVCGVVAAITLLRTIASTLGQTRT